MLKPSLDVGVDLRVGIDIRVAQYVQLRDKIKELKDAIKPYTEALEVLGNLLLAHLNDTKVESVRTENGTFFKTTRRTASLEDPDVFMRFVIENELWDMLDRKPNAKVIEDYLNTNKALPPGVKYTEWVDVNVRRSS